MAPKCVFPGVSALFRGRFMNEEMERGLIKRFQSGDHAAYNLLFDAYHVRVIHRALYVLRKDKESAPDVAQEVFLRAFTELPYWRGDARLSTWLYRTTSNVCFEQIREEGRHRLPLEPFQKERTGPSAEDALLEKEVMCEIEYAVSRLPLRQRAIFSLRHYQNMRFPEIAERLGITQGGARANYHRAISTLQELLKDFLHINATT